MRLTVWLDVQYFASNRSKLNLEDLAVRTEGDQPESRGEDGIRMDSYSDMDPAVSSEGMLFELR
jgi:hypothetical protein